jgi:aspartate oxidase
MSYAFLGQFDVIVLGGGLSGLHAAIAAEKAGAKVALISKKKAGRSGSSVVSKSVHRFSPNEEGLKNDYFNKAMEAGRHINDPSLLRILLNQGASAVRQLIDYYPPMVFNEKESGTSLQSNLAYCHPKKGIHLTVPMLDYIRRHTKIEVFDAYVAYDLMVKENHISGVFLEKNNTLYTMACNALVIATGGFAYLYSETSSTNDATGDGVAMALRKGISVTDMEFTQFYPYRVVSPAIHDIFPNIFSEGAYFTNEKGERFMADYPKKELENRDILARAIFNQKSVYLNVKSCNQSFLEKECPELLSIIDRYPNTPLKVVPKAHFTMGGLVVNQTCATSVPGVYACGESVGGVHGANRLAGYALTETAVFGPIAGDHAAKHAIALDRTVRACTFETDLLPTLGNTNVLPLKKAIRETMWEYVGIQKSQTSLLKAEEILCQLKSQFDLIQPSKYKDWIETHHLLSLSFIVIRASLRRQESRGAHYRIDCPEEQIEFLGNYCFDGHQLRFQSIKK